MVMSSKWMRLIGLVGFTAVLVSCKQTPQAPMNANYATMKITVSDKKFSTSYSATIRGRQDIDIYPQVFWQHLLLQKLIHLWIASVCAHKFSKSYFFPILMDH